MDFSIDFDSKIPFHIQAEQLLRRMINSEQYSSGATLPNEVDIARDLGISRNTLRHAINRLVNEGLLIRKKGVGTTVNNLGRASSAAKNWLSFSQEMKALGIPVKNYELHVFWERVSGEVAKFFHTNDGTTILKMSRVRGGSAHPIVYFCSYFNPSMGMTGEENFTQPLYTLLERKYSVIVDKSVEEIAAMLADEFLAEKLHIQKGDAILRRKRMVFDISGAPIEYNMGYYRADSFTYRVEAERG